MKTETLREITQKLKNEKDISIKETDEVYHLFSTEVARNEFNPFSDHYNPELFAEFINYLKTANYLLNTKHAGNFVCSFPLATRDCESKRVYDPIRPILENIRFNLPVIDRAKSAVLSKDLYRLTKNKRYITAYKSSKEVMDTPRAGLFRINGLYPFLRDNFVSVPSMSSFFMACYKASFYWTNKSERIAPEWFSGLLVTEAADSMKIPFVTFNFKPLFIVPNDVFLAPEKEAEKLEKTIGYIEDINKILINKKLIVPESYKGQYFFGIDNWQETIETGKELFIKKYKELEKTIDDQSETTR